VKTKNWVLQNDLAFYSSLLSSYHHHHFQYHYLAAVHLLFPVPMEACKQGEGQLPHHLHINSSSINVQLEGCQSQYHHPEQWKEG
jgi:hypothetical protein